jgi:hypothetical protein
MMFEWDMKIKYTDCGHKSIFRSGSDKLFVVSWKGRPLLQLRKDLCPSKVVLLFGKYEVISNAVQRSAPNMGMASGSNHHLYSHSVTDGIF